MTIITTGLGAAAPLSPRRRVTAGGGFTVPEDAAPPIGAPALSAAADISLAGLLALQAEQQETVQDRAARKHGHDILAALNALQHSLLGEGITLAQLHHLAGLATTIPQAADPRLLAVMAQISLRAQVELARYGLK